MSAFQDNIELIREVRLASKADRPSPYFGRAERKPDQISKDRFQRRQLQEKFWAADFRKANATGRLQTWLAERALNRAQEGIRQLDKDPTKIEGTWVHSGGYKICQSSYFLPETRQRVLTERWWKNKKKAR